MAELGLPGLLAVIGVAVGLVAVALKARIQSRRRANVAVSTALLACFFVFLVHASVDWMWQVPAVTVLALAAAAIAGGHGARRRLKLAWGWRAAVAVAALAACLVQVPGLISTLEIRRSQAAERRG